MPTLNWIGKEAVVRHHKDVPYRLLEPVRELSHGDMDSGNLIIQGDNLHALKALLPRYAGKVKCIYIDPPYNTGNENWVYNDNVNSQKIRKWLGEVVGKEGETLDRHDRWLCMMYPRLLMLRMLLSQNGIIFISIDDNEFQSLRFLMDEIYGKNNFVATIIWQKIFSPKNTAKHFSEDHDYIVIYSNNAEHWRPNLLERSAEAEKRYKNLDDDPRGPWTSGDLQARNYYSEGTYSINCPSGRVIQGPGPGMYWRVSKEKFLELDNDNRIYWGTSGNNMPRMKRFLSEVKRGVIPQTLWKHNDVGHTQEAKKDLLSIVDFKSSDEVFITPKPIRLIERIINIATNPGDILLDSFAGTGTSGHAILKVNNQNIKEEKRKFILIEVEGDVAKKVLQKRITRAISGYQDNKKNYISGLGGGFQYCVLSEESLFSNSGKIQKDIKFHQLAEFVWFMETGTGYIQENQGPLLGVHERRAVYLLYNGILKDRSVDGGNVLTSPIFSKLPAFDGPKVIYAAACRLGAARLNKLGIVFKQIPYELNI